MLFVVRFASDDAHTPLSQQAAVALDVRDLVLGKQHGDAAGEALHHLLLTPLHGRHIDLHIAGADTMGGKIMPRMIEMVRGFQQGLGGNAADIETHAAERGFALFVHTIINAGRLQAQLRTADGRHVTTGPTAENDHIKVRHCRTLPFWPLRHNCKRST